MDAIEKMNEAVHCLHLELDAQIVSDVKDKWLKVMAEIKRLHRQIAFRDAFIEDRGETEYLHSWVWEGWTKEDYEATHD